MTKTVLRKSLVALLVLVLVGGAWVIASQMESPDQAAARAVPPAPVPVVAQVHSGFLAAGMTVAVTAERQERRTVDPPPELAGVVTAQVLTAGAALGPGAVALRVDGRPVFAIPGSFPLYRDIAPGDTGDDVSAVQQGLKQAGLYKGQVTGSYGPGTQAAVTAMYKAAGYTPPRDAPVDKGMSTPDAPEPKAAPGGPLVLRTEVLVVGSLPAMIESVAPVGSRIGADNPPLVLTAGEVVLRIRVPFAAVGVLVEGATGTFWTDAGDQGQATVTTIARDPQAAEAEIVFTVGQDTVTPGTTYTVSVANPANETGSNLLVPITAVVTRGGTAYVYVQDGTSFVEVPVRVVGQQGGTAAVVPTDTTSTLLRDGAGVRISTGVANDGGVDDG
ncbi:MAG: peptidoglycan-binding protein [Micrococcales bacterium]|nr:peptidoglycan-binding protein [Micrococcales bacterium]